MTDAEVEEKIDYVLNEVISLSILIVDFHSLFWIEHSTRMILWVFTCHTAGIRNRIPTSSFSELPTWRYRGSQALSFRRGAEE